MPHRSDQELIDGVHNAARFFTEHRQVGWVLLAVVLGWGIYGNLRMPKRKDPDIPVREAVVLCPWPGHPAIEVEQLITRPIEAEIARNPAIHPPGAGGAFGISSLSLPDTSVTYIQLAENVADPQKEFSDINLKLSAIGNLPKGAGPIRLLSDFGDTAALMLTVASPPEREVALTLRAGAIRQAIRQTRAHAHDQANRVTLVAAFPLALELHGPVRMRDDIMQLLAARGLLSDTIPIQGPGFVGIDGITREGDSALLAATEAIITQRLGGADFNPDMWMPVAIRNPGDTGRQLAAVAGPRYSYRQLADFTNLLQRGLQSVPQVSRVDRVGLLRPQIDLEYSQNRLAAYGLNPYQLSDLLSAHNITAPGGELEIGPTSLPVYPSGRFSAASDIGQLIVAHSGAGPVYLRDLADIERGYQNPPQYLNYYTHRLADGRWQTDRAITLAVYMRSGEQIGRFGGAIDRRLALLSEHLPDDLVIAHTSDQPRQVAENLGVFMAALYEAVALVVLVALIGFWDWRAALLMAASIPLTLALTFGLMQLLGVDLQQVSIASLIIALGLLVDDPVVAGDAIKRELGAGHPPVISAWLGPTKLARAILFATITNVVAFLPFLLLSGDTGQFLWSLPVVITCALVASRLVSMTFVPLLGYFLLRPGRAEEPIAVRRGQGFSGLYYRLGSSFINHRWVVLCAALLVLAAGGYGASHLESAFFPVDLQYLSYIDLWLPNSATFADTEMTAAAATEIVTTAAVQWAERTGRDPHILKSVTAFVGGGAPRFWVSVSPQSQQPNYAQLVIELRDKTATAAFAGLIQRRLSAQLPGVYADVQQLQTNPVRHPVEIHISAVADVSPSREGAEIEELRRLSYQVEQALRAVPAAARVRDDWGADVPAVDLQINADRANLAGITNENVADSAAAGLSGITVGSFLEDDRQIPIVARLQREERARIGDLENLYVYGSRNDQKVPLSQIATALFALRSGRIVRRDHFRTVTVFGFPRGDALPSRVLAAAMPDLRTIEQELPPGYTITIGGEYAKQKQGFGELLTVLAISLVAIYLALTIQFDHAIKPALVFASVPFGVLGGIAALRIGGLPFGFMAFLGIASLIGVIVSHVIVLFDFVEEMHDRGEPLLDSLLDAGIERLRPVLITVGATVLALVPLAIHGGPLWQPLCYTQIGGLCVATLVELLLVPVLYSTAVLDMKIIGWQGAMSGKGLADSGIRQRRTS